MLSLPSFFPVNREIVISTEAAHGPIVSSAVEKSAVAVAFRFCVFFASHPQQIPVFGLRIYRTIIHLTSTSKPRLKFQHLNPKKAPNKRGGDMATQTAGESTTSLTRKRLIDLLNEDLAREFQAIIAYVNYSQVLKGAAYMNIAAELAVHATEELSHAITISNQIDYLGGMPTTIPKPVKTSEKAEDMLRFDLDNENETIRQYRRRIKQCDELGEFATAEQIRQILLQEQDHQIALATALGIEVPNVGIAD
jgi:bacterioferritin